MRKVQFCFVITMALAALAGSCAPAATTVWLSTSPTGTPIAGDTITLASNANLQLYCFVQSDQIGNTFETMVGYDTSDATDYGAGKDSNDGQYKKLTLASLKSDIVSSINVEFGVFSSAGYADSQVVLDASGREASNSSLNGRPYGFVGRLARASNTAPTSPVNCFSFTLHNSMTTAGDSQYVVLSNYSGGSSYSTAWKYGTDLYEDSYALRVVNGSSNIPLVGTTNKSVLSTLMTTAASNYNWVLWGRVSARDANGFNIDDGSGVVIKVVAPGNTVIDGDYVSVKGSLNVTTTPPTLTSQTVTKH